DAYEKALDILEDYKVKWPEIRGTAHFFVGTKEIAKRFLDLGFHISFSGVITFVKDYEEIVDFVPLDKILPETDAPFATPSPHRGKRNQPEYVLEVVEKIAEIKKLPFEQVQRQLLENTKILFSI
ncbi:TatD family hydrolase, partial [Candidatus Nomurabacteria bacterium]|nr:TatD family hydrolase [Candidatus Nomurabacteria bacterium]